MIVSARTQTIQYGDPKGLEFADFLSKAVVDGWTIISSGHNSLGPSGAWWAILQKVDTTTETV